MIGLLLALALSRPYHVETVASLAASKHTHVEVSGTVTLVRKEADGDLHIRISDGKIFVVAEIIPTLKPSAAFPVPTVGQCVRVRGIHRREWEPGHGGGWEEIHPVEALVLIPCLK
jgi:hypothetical protein